MKGQKSLGNTAANCKLDCDEFVIADDESLGQQIPDCSTDVLVSCGDLPDFLILEVAKRCHCREILAVKGNHDSSGSFAAPIRDLHLSRFQFRGISFGGFCG